MRDTAAVSGLEAGPEPPGRSEAPLLLSRRWGSRLAWPSAVVAGVAALWLRFNAPPGAGGLLYPHDLINYFYPLAIRVGERLAAGELPLWNPDACSGIPLLATLQVAAFYPPTWLEALVPAAQALPVQMLAHCLCGALFAAGFFRATGRGATASILGGIWFAYACVLAETFWPSMASTIAWIPALFLCVEKLAQRFTWGWWWGLVAAGALQHLAGFAQAVLYGYGLLLPFAGLRILAARRVAVQRASPVPSALGVLAALALAAGIAAVQLAPTWELVSWSPRAEALEPWQLHYLWNAASAREVVANALDPTPAHRSFHFGKGGGYLGSAALLLGVAGILGGVRRASTWLLLLGGALCLLLADGYRGSLAELYRLATSIPGVPAFRAPERIRLLAFLCWIALAVRGADLVTGPARGSSPGPRRLALLGTGAVALAAAFTPLGWRALVAAALVLGCAIESRRLAHGVPARLALLVFVVVDLALATGRYGSLRDFPSPWAEAFHAHGATLLDASGLAALRTERPSQRLALAGGPGPRKASILPLNVAGPLGLAPLASCYDVLLPRAWPDLHRALELPEFPGAFVYNLDPVRHEHVLDLLSVGRVVLVQATNPGLRWANRSEAARRRDERFRAGRAPSPDPPRGVQVRVLENPDALPRAYFVARHRIVEPEEALRLVAEDGFDPRSSVLLDAGPADPLPNGPARFAPARITRSEPERVALRLDAPSDGYLVLTDSYYPGWRAEVDGTQVGILRANGLHRAIPVSSGPHEIEFRYAPGSLRLGASISLASLVLTLLAPLAARIPPLRGASR